MPEAGPQKKVHGQVWKRTRSANGLHPFHHWPIFLPAPPQLVSEWSKTVNSSASTKFTIFNTNLSKLQCEDAVLWQGKRDAKSVQTLFWNVEICLSIPEMHNRFQLPQVPSYLLWMWRTCLCTYSSWGTWDSICFPRVRRSHFPFWRRHPQCHWSSSHNYYLAHSHVDQFHIWTGFQPGMGYCRILQGYLKLLAISGVNNSSMDRNWGKAIISLT